MSEETTDHPSRPPAVSGPLAVRRAGVLLHITSLPSESGPGTLGAAAYSFVDFLHAAGCTVWQVLPLGPTHDEDGSPYNAVSAMAGNPDLVGLDLLREQDLLEDDDLARVRDGRLSRGGARELAARRFLDRRLDPGPSPYADAPIDFDVWCEANKHWLEDYVRFVALREKHGSTAWITWTPALRDRKPAPMAEALGPLTDRLALLRVEQWFFACQWQALREYAAARGVLLFGDLPIFVSHDSSDVWAGRDQFRLDEEGRPTTVTGVPPDYFSEDGQRWNNPHYDWERMAKDDFAWWRARLASQRQLFDLVRIDHFRGFEAAWHVPVEAETAKEGHWEDSPGREVLTALEGVSGEGTLVAEDLGLITPAVDDLRREFALPGMKVLHFAFDGDADNAYLPEHHEELSVTYTGTHDNDTTLGWWKDLDKDTRSRVRHVLKAQGIRPRKRDMPWPLVELAMASVARLAVVPAQDLLGLGSDSRMNTPGTADGNWSWQADAGAFDAALADRLRGLVARHDRLVQPG